MTPNRREFFGAVVGLPGLARRTASSRLQEPVAGVCDVTSFGAVGDGSSDDTAAIAAAVEACPANGRLIFPPARQYRIGTIALSKNLVVEAHGATFALGGPGAGFRVTGLVDFFRVFGGTYLGSGDARDNQIPWTFGNVPGAKISNVTIEGVTTRHCTVGVKVAGTRDEPVRLVTVVDCRFFDSAGLEGGTGYGLQFTHGDFGKAIGCHFERCQRHGLYFAEGKHYAAVANSFRDHRGTVASGDLRTALSIARSDNVSAVGNVFDGCHDGTVAIDTDLYGTRCRNVTLSGNAFQDSTGFDVVVGSTLPAEHGRPEHVVITGNVFRRSPEKPAGAFIDVRAASHLTIADNNIVHEAEAEGVPVGVLLRGSGGGEFTQYVHVHGNVFCLRSATGRAYAMEIADGILDGSSVVDVLLNMDHSSDGVLRSGRGRNRNLRVDL